MYFIFIREISVITSFAFHVTNKQKCEILCCMKFYVHDNFHDNAFRTLRNDIIRPWNLYSGVLTCKKYIDEKIQNGKIPHFSFFSFYGKMSYSL